MFRGRVHTLHIDRVNENLEIRNKSKRGIRVCLMAYSTWESCFQTQGEREELMTKILQYFYA